MYRVPKTVEEYLLTIWLSISTTAESLVLVSSAGDSDKVVNFATLIKCVNA